MKIFYSNINKKVRTIPLLNKDTGIGKTKYLPAFSKEWKNTVYFYNKEFLKNIPVNDLTINKLIKAYFNLYFQNYKFINSLKETWLKKRQLILKRIHVSNAEIKHVNNKAIITLYVLNLERNILRKKYLKINKIIQNTFLKDYFFWYKKNIQILYNILNKYKNVNQYRNILVRDLFKKRKFITYKLQYLNQFLVLKDFYLKKILILFIQKYYKKNLKYLRRYDLLYSLNEKKFNPFMLLSKLNNYLEEILGKKIEYKIINLKSIVYHPDIFTNFLILKLRRKHINVHSILSRLLVKSHLPQVNKIKERTYLKRDQNLDLYLNQYQDLKITSNIHEDNILVPYEASQCINKVYESDGIHNSVFQSIGYKNLGGIRLKINGRLTKRYRADRSVHVLRWKGGLKNIDSSFKRLSSVLFRGNTNSNNAYAWSKSKRRIGSFAVKGWISGK